MLNGLDELPAHISSRIEALQSQTELPGISDWRIYPESKTDVSNYPVAALWKEISNLYGCKFPLLSRHVAPNMFSLHVTSCSTERVWSRMRHLYRPLRNKLDPCRAKKILLVSLADSFEKNMHKRQRISGYSEESEPSARIDSDLEEEMRFPDDWLEGIALDDLENIIVLDPGIQPVEMPQQWVDGDADSDHPQPNCAEQDEPGPDQASRAC